MSFDGSGDAYYLSSGTTSSFTIDKAPTTLVYTGDSSADFHDPAEPRKRT